MFMAELDEGTHAIIEKIARETAEQYLEITKELVGKELALHTANCEVAKYSRLKNVFSALLGGIVVAIANWILKKV
jgi:hypothetical protein